MKRFAFNVIKTIVIYFKVVILRIKIINGYICKDVGNLPIVGCNHFKGYEIINTKTNKVVYRRVKSWGYINGLYNPNKYKVVSKFFIKNT